MHRQFLALLVCFLLSAPCFADSVSGIPPTPIGTSGQISVTGTSPPVISIPSNAALPGSPTTTTQSLPDSSTKIATTSYVQNAVLYAMSGINPAVATQCATITVLPNSPVYYNGTAGVGATLTASSAAALVIDGYTVLLNDRVLVRNQAAPADNGIYVQTTLGTGLVPWVLTRASDFNAADNIDNTGAIPVVNGTVNATTSYVLTSHVATVGTDPLTFTQFSYPLAQIATSGANSNITSLSGLTTPLSAGQGGTGAANLNALAKSGANADITGLSALTTITNAPLLGGPSNLGIVAGPTIEGTSKVWSTSERVTVSGTPTNGEQPAIIFTDVAITGSPLTISYTEVVPSDNNTAIATGLTNAINANAALAAAGITATSTGAVVTIVSTTAENTAYAVTNSSHTTLTLNGAYTVTLMAASSRNQRINATNGTTTVVLPDATTCVNKRITLTKTDSTANTVPLTTVSSQMINGSSSGSIILSSQYQSMELYSDAVKWCIVSNPTFGAQPTNGQIPIGSSASSLYTPGSITSTGGTITSTSGAGSLNLDVANGGITTTQISGSAGITGSQLASSAVDYSQLASDVLQDTGWLNLTSDNILNLYSTPVQLIAAPGPGEAIVLESFAIQRAIGTAYSGGGQVNIVYAGSGTAQMSCSSSIFTTVAGNGEYVHAAATQNLVGLLTATDAAVNLSNASSFFTTGNATAKIRVWYRVITF